MNDWERIVTGVAFPVAVATYLLVYMRQTIESLKDTIAKQTEVLVKLCEHLNGNTKPD